MTELEEETLVLAEYAKLETKYFNPVLMRTTYE